MKRIKVTPRLSALLSAHDMSAQLGDRTSAERQQTNQAIERLLTRMRIFAAQKPSNQVRR